MGMDRAGDADSQRSRETVALPPLRGERCVVSAPHRLPLARSFGVLWTMADGVFPLRSMATGGAVDAHLAAVAGPCPRHRSHRLGRVCGGWDVCPRTSALSRSPASRESSRRKRGFARIPDEALGCSRGGITTKIHLVTEGNGYPLAFVLTPGNTHDSKALEPALDAICVPSRRGRPRKRPDSLVADRGYSYQRCRDALRKRGISHVIPERSDQRKRRLCRPGRRPKFDRTLYRERNRVERAISRLKQFRRIATRYEKRAWNYHAFVLIGAIVVWIRHLSDTP